MRGPSRGYVLEVYGTHFVLPDLGPIGELRQSTVTQQSVQEPMVWRIRATSRRPWRGLKIATSRTRSSTSIRASCSSPSRSRVENVSARCQHFFRSGPLAIRRRRVARQLCAVQVRPAPLQRHQYRLVRSLRQSVNERAHAYSNIRRIRRSSPCSRRRQIIRVRRSPISSSSHRVGASRSTRSGE